MAILMMKYILAEKAKYIILIGLFLGAALLTVSMSALLNTALLIILFLRGVKKSVIGYITIVILGSLLLFLLYQYFISIGGVERVSNFRVEGTSIYYRLVAPIFLLTDSLVDYPFGVGLGQVDYIQRMPYMINWEGGSNTNIDNSFFLLSFHFGYIGVLISLLVLCYLFYLFIEGRSTIFVFLALTLLLSETGALWSPNVISIIGYAIILIRSTTAEVSHKIYYKRTIDPYVAF